MSGRRGTGGQPRTRRERLVIPAVNPAGGDFFDVQISYDRLQQLPRRSRGAILEAAYIVPKILRGPSAIFEGLRRDADEDNRSAGWLCYCGVPDRAYRQNGDPVPPWPGKVFLVFVNHERVVYLWYWAKCDADQPALPQAHETRFVRRAL